MNTEAQTFEHPGWLRAWLAVFTTIAAFRVAKLIFGLLFFCIQTNIFGLPLVIMMGIANFVHIWNTALVQGVSVAVAVLAARWVESKLLQKSRRAAFGASLVFTVLACCPIYVYFPAIQPAMISPLEIAIHDHYSFNTTAAIIDRYPHFINGSHMPWQDRPLADAAREGESNVVELLIRKGANVDAAVQQLQQFRDETAVKLVLDCSQKHKSDSKQ